MMEKSNIGTNYFIAAALCLSFYFSSSMIVRDILSREKLSWLVHLNAACFLVL
jgi:hypothetical protein